IPTNTPTPTAAPTATAAPTTAAPSTTAASTTEQPASTGSAAVSIVNFSFNDQVTTVSVGDTVTFTNNEVGIAHTTTATEGLWNSGLLASGDTFDITFTEAGTFNFFCSIHPSMTGTITVTE
ncbi:MAG: cupredoxin domain-containing protein, partial [Acidobacteria bacterium]|nr:cupredoxin domain-containing protein [Acidobacteriota bacterium]